jgi:hypothetical protein
MHLSDRSLQLFDGYHFGIAFAADVRTRAAGSALRVSTIV